MSLRRAALSGILLSALLCSAGASRACFGTELRIGVETERGRALAAYSAGYFIEEKTGIAPDFVDAPDPAALLREGKIDLALAPEGAPLPSGAASRPAGTVPGMGNASFWIRNDALEDIRFTTLERALRFLPRFFGSGGYRDALESAAEPKKAARKAVADAD